MCNTGSMMSIDFNGRIAENSSGWSQENQWWFHS